MSYGANQQFGRRDDPNQDNFKAEERFDGERTGRRATGKVGKRIPFKLTMNRKFHHAHAETWKTGV
eukprot:CAMPEP_0177258318 /NCGR_PEP_ID=MMETSP0367-20130122/58041_1 /TAXON_ID=447022 ORGANISM="Scrippsiella hangoei-like, Strain SHHI-4" /NCGR_SAMPLE_ID=MMETSP0367 /ASSEMBLY_ACC=CAM_ASM_000362 /LENGTH=65 /DNA_ID=CAMNT_0018712521 /DNA_START=163 /DNA_END=360 /DNA_ORIENTATION=+